MAVRCGKGGDSPSRAKAAPSKEDKKKQGDAHRLC